MADEGADLLDIGGESTRPGHAEVDEAEELRRVVPVVRAVRAALPGMPLTIDTTKAGGRRGRARCRRRRDQRHLGRGRGRRAGERRRGPRRADRASCTTAPSPATTTSSREVIDDLRRAIDRAIGRRRAARRTSSSIPGIGFGKTAEQNLELLRDLGALRALGRPILLGTSRKSTLGKVLDLPADERLEATLATTALGIAAGVDIVRVHDVRENVRAARMADAIVRGTWQEARA